MNTSSSEATAKRRTAHTPGPMVVLFNGRDAELHRAEGMRDATAKTRIMVCDTSRESIQFLRTIAAATDLLEALRYIADGNVEHFNFEEYRSTVEDFRETAKAAIAKATGEGA